MDSISAFFDALTERAQPLLGNARGTLRFDLGRGTRTASWLVAIDAAAVTVSRGSDAADCVVRGDRSTFEGVVKGEVNMTAALLRGAILAEGDVELIVLFQRLFPGPPGARGPRRRTSSTGIRA